MTWDDVGPKIILYYVRLVIGANIRIYPIYSCVCMSLIYGEVEHEEHARV